MPTAVTAFADPLQSTAIIGGICMTAMFDEEGNRHRIELLTDRGIFVWGPHRVYVGDDVPLDQIGQGAVLMNATITGKDTVIGTKAEIGTSGLARIHNAQIGPHVQLGAGTYENCVLLSGAKTRGFAELRPGTVLEEDSDIGHNVGLKNTTLTAGAVAGSQINFCDVFLTGGSSRSDHSEIGSGTIHFNFDPRGDKYGSLMGDASGCLLKARRIFVGGNVGIVAPVYLGFGAVIAAGATVRSDVGQNQLSTGNTIGRSGEYDLDRYFDLSKKFCTTAKLIGNLHAFRAWYQQVRLPFADSEDKTLVLAADGEFKRHIEHRTKELIKVIAKLEKSLSKPNDSASAQMFFKQHRMLLRNSDEIYSLLLHEEYEKTPISFLTEYSSLRRRRKHTDSVRAIGTENGSIAAQWLGRIVERPFLAMKALFDGAD
jgi:hypothetical protein